MRRGEFIREAERQGWGVHLRDGGQLALTHPDASKTVFTSATPSDWRKYENTFAEMRRALPSEPKTVKFHQERPKRRPPPTHRPEPLCAFGSPLMVHRLPVPERPEYPPEPRPRRRIAGGPAGFRSCLDRI